MDYYRFGQVRRSQLCSNNDVSKLLKDFDENYYTLKDRIVEASAEANGGVYFLDKEININGENSLYNFQGGVYHYYLLRYKIKKQKSSQTISLKLERNLNNDVVYQDIDTVTIPGTNKTSISDLDKLEKEYLAAAAELRDPIEREQTIEIIKKHFKTLREEYLTEEQIEEQRAAKMKEIDEDEKLIQYQKEERKEYWNAIYDAMLKDISDESQWVTFDTIIAPNHNYKTLWFMLSRNVDDYKASPEQGEKTQGRKIQIQIVHFAEIQNIISAIQTDLKNPDVSIFQQIGVQSAPGQLLCIDGEPIRVGRTGIYEINNGIPISFFGVISYEEYENFILDYQY